LPYLPCKSIQIKNEKIEFINLDSKQSKQKKRGCIAMKLVAQMLVKAGLTHLITVDLHQKEIQGFFDIPVDNLRASSFLLDYIQQQVKSNNNNKKKEGKKMFIF
jgi:phosphoribosylpyrophosphate synthetase